MDINHSYILGVQEKISDFQINLLDSGIQVLDISPKAIEGGCDITAIAFKTNDIISLTEENLEFCRKWCNSHTHETLFRGLLSK